MPLTTYMAFTVRPDIYIRVFDGGGGGGNDYTVDLTVTYDASVLRFDLGSDDCVDIAPGVCGWTDVFCPADGRTFTVEFTRLTTEKTYISALAEDDYVGQVSFSQLTVPRVNSIPTLLRLRGRKTSKKARRKP